MRALCAMVIVVAACGRLDFDPIATPGASSRCSAVGMVPGFDPTLHVAVTQGCPYYNIAADTGIAVAQCSAFDIGIGPADGPLTLLAIPAVNGMTNLAEPRLVPEGDRMFVNENNFDGNGDGELGDYIPDGAGGWKLRGILPIAPSTDALDYHFGQPTRGPHPHAFLTEYTSDPTLDGTAHELVEQDDGSWLEVGLYTPAELGQQAQAINLTADGLRAVYVALDNLVHYADRPSLDARFGPWQVPAGAPMLSNPIADYVMSADCTRIYFYYMTSDYYVEVP